MFAVVEVAPARLVERRVRVAMGVHVHGADAGGQHHAPDAGVRGHLHHVERPGDHRLDDLLLPNNTASVSFIPAEIEEDILLSGRYSRGCRASVMRCG